MEVNMLNRIQKTIIVIGVAIVLVLLSRVQAEAARPIYQNNSAAQCSEGMRYFQAEAYEEALLLLETSFSEREYEHFDSQNDLGICALILGQLRQMYGNGDEAIEAYIVALEAFRQTGNREQEAVTLNDMALVYRVQSRYDEALEYYQKALNIAREIGNQMIESISLNGIGVVHDSRSQYAEALQFFQQALVLQREVNDRAGQGMTLNNIGAIYRSQGLFTQALEYFEQSLVIRREVGDRRGEGVTLNNIGAIYRSQGLFTQALEYFEQSLVIRREVGDRRGEATTLSSMGGLYRSQGQYMAALQFFQQALVLQREVNDRSGQGTTLNSIGLVYDNQGRYAEALNYYHQSLSIRYEVKDRAGESTTLNNIGLVYNNQGRYTEALQHFEQALIIVRELHNQAGESTTLNNIGLAYNNQGRYTEALKYYQEALSIVRKVGNQFGEATTLTNIGSINRVQGMYGKALQNFEEALAIQRQVNDQAGEGITQANIGLVYKSQEQYDDALEHYQQALLIQRKIGDQTGEGSTLTNIGDAYQLQGQRNKALNYYQQAVDIIDNVRAYAGSEIGRTAFSVRFASSYDSAILLAYQLKQFDLSFQFSERARARAFLDSIATGQVEFADNMISTVVRNEQEAYTTLRAAQDTLVKAKVVKSSDPILITKLEQQVYDAKLSYEKAINAITQQENQLTVLVPKRKNSVLDRVNIQSLLDPETTLVSYYVFDNQTLAFVLNRDRFNVVELEPGHAQLHDTIVELRQFSSLTELHPSSAIQLYTWLIAPLQSKGLLQSRHIAIVPHRLLHYLPFAALSNGKHYFIDDHTLTVLPSASSLSFIASNANNPLDNPLILGNPATGNVALPSLLEAEREAKMIAQLYKLEPLIRQTATEQAVREHVAKAGILHLAAHGQFNTDEPLRSSIVLAPSRNDDGRLEVREVYGLHLSTVGLVVLSACQTQVNDASEQDIVTAGDEVVGLTRALFFAGTPSVIASLWNIDDQATGLLMERFYTHLRAGMSKAEALQAAQIEVRVQYPNPYYWAGFVLSGDPGEASGMYIWWNWINSRSVWLVRIIGWSTLLLLVVLVPIWVLRRKHSQWYSNRKKLLVQDGEPVIQGIFPPADDELLAELLARSKSDTRPLEPRDTNK
jgi:tetratricopeptide (TPR) repeat protein